MADGEVQGLDYDPNENITLVSSDNKRFVVKKSLISHSVVLSAANDSDKDNQEILTKVKADILEKVIEFLQKFSENKSNVPQSNVPQFNVPLPKPASLDSQQDWVKDFVNVDPKLLFKLNFAANFLDIQSLLELTCAKFAILFKGKTADEIKEQYNIIFDCKSICKRICERYDKKPDMCVEVDVSQFENESKEPVIRCIHTLYDAPPEKPSRKAIPETRQIPETPVSRR